MLGAVVPNCGYSQSEVLPGIGDGLHQQDVVLLSHHIIGVGSVPRVVQVGVHIHQPRHHSGVGVFIDSYGGAFWGSDNVGLPDRLDLVPFKEDRSLLDGRASLPIEQEASFD